MNLEEMNLEEAIEQTKELSARKYEKAIRCQFCYENPDRNMSFVCMNCSIGYGRLADWLEELKELREYKEKYRWHDLRKNPDDIPDVEHRKKEYFHVVQEGKETGPTILQYKKDFGFGFYNDFGNGPKFTEVDTNFTAPIVAWKEIEKFESEGENADTSRR